MSFSESTKEWSGLITALVAVLALGLTAGYYSANSENASLKRDLELATNARGALAIMESLQELSDASNNVFRFEKHAQEISEMETKVAELKTTVASSRTRIAKLETQITEKNATIELKDNEISKLSEALKRKHSLSEKFRLSKNSSRSFFDAKHTVGLVSLYSSFVGVSTPGGRENLSVGEVTVWRTDYTVCKLTLSAINSDNNTVDFLLLCD